MTDSWLPGRDRRAVRHPATPGSAAVRGERRVLVAGGGIAGVTAAVGLAERGVQVVLIEPHDQLGGRVRSWPVTNAAGEVTMSRGFHAFFRQYYNLRALLRRADPALQMLTGVRDYPVMMPGGYTDTFARIPGPRRPTWPCSSRGASIFICATCCARIWSRRSNSWMSAFPAPWPPTTASAAHLLDRLRFPHRVRHLALEVFARSFFVPADQFPAGELVAMFHLYFLGSAEGLLFDVPGDDYQTALWAPLRAYLTRVGVSVRTGWRVTGLDLSEPHRIGATVAEVTADRAPLTEPYDAVVLATDVTTTRHLLGATTGLGDQRWRRSIADTSAAPPFAVWRLWLDRPVAPERAAFLGTSGYGLVDNVTVLERFEEGARRWADAHHGSVVEVHAYALNDASRPDLLRQQLREQLSAIYPETATATLIADEWLVERDCPRLDLRAWRSRPGVTTPDPRILLAGDGIRCDLPVALMERAATTGWMAANSWLPVGAPPVTTCGPPRWPVASREFARCGGCWAIRLTRRGTAAGSGVRRRRGRPPTAGGRCAASPAGQLRPSTGRPRTRTGPSRRSWPR